MDASAYKRNVIKVYLPNSIFQESKLRSEKCERLNLEGKYKAINNSQCVLEVFVQNISQPAHDDSSFGKNVIGSVDYALDSSADKTSQVKLKEKIKKTFFLQLSFENSSLAKCGLVYKNQLLNEQNTTFYLFVYDGKSSLYEYAFEKHSLLHTMAKSHSVKERINAKIDR